MDFMKWSTYISIISSVLLTLRLIDVAVYRLIDVAAFRLDIGVAYYRLIGIATDYSHHFSERL